MEKKLSSNSLVIDIGKTHIKIHVLTDALESVFSKQMGNEVVFSTGYPSVNIEKIWQWLQAGIKEITALYRISAISITTHGATAALINRNKNQNDALVLPVLDYEFDGLERTNESYQLQRAPFEQTYSPELPAGLNLGRQLYWLAQTFPEKFSQATDILMYPQYWLWRFTGARYSEVTSLGCHTDLWSIEQQDFSSIVDAQSWRALFPELVPAWFNAGSVLKHLQESLGLPAHCRVHVGLHDSNASFLRYRLTQQNNPFTVISTGTWTISMASQVALSHLDPKKDMLANVDATGQAVACARFMGGREFAVICQLTGANLDDGFTLNDLQQVITESVFALPDFSQGSGPFGGAKSGFKGNIDDISGIALASLYCALMIDYQLDMLSAQGDIYVEGAFLKNPLLCGILNQLRKHQKVYLSNDDTGTVQGAAYLTQWDKVDISLDVSAAEKLQLANLSDYRKQWLNLIIQD